MSEEEEVKRIVEEAKNQLKLECRSAIFEGNRKLRSDDLKISQDPEEFTKRHIIEKILQLLNVNYETGEARFSHLTGTRKVDYAIRKDARNFLLEAKPINSDLFDKSSDGAVNQVKGLFKLSEVKEGYGFGVATDGLKWIIINPRSEIIAELSLESDFKKLRDFLTGKREAKKERRQEEISKRFFQWYNALMHGGSFKDNEGRQRKISPQESLVSNIRNVESESDREEIAQTIVDRLIFIKFIQAKGLIKSDVLEYLATIRQDALKWTLDQLFFSVLNTERDKRPQVDPKFDGIPYLNGSLFTKTKPEEQNQYYNVTAEILQSVIEFLDSFRFVSEIGVDVSEALDPEILGYIFERAMTATDRKGTGAYYTPKYITRYISENTIYPFILERARVFLRDEKNYKDSELPESLDDLILNVSSRSLSEVYGDIVQQVRVLDPACGSGAFLLAASNVLLELYNRFEDRLGLRNSQLALKKVILKNSIYGVDLNHEGIEIAKLRLWLWLAESYDPEKKIEPLPNIEYNIRAGNSLVGFVDITRFKEARLSLDDFMESEESLTEYLNERDRLIESYKEASGDVARELRGKIEFANDKVKRLLDIRLFQELMAKVGITSDEYRRLEAFHWGFEFHDIFSNGSGGSGFDVVIGNPPYVQLQKMKAETDILQEVGFETFARTGDIYCLFYEKGIDILRQSGNLCYITSNKWMRAAYGKKLREYFIKYNPKILIDLGPGIFESATVDTNILFLQKTSNEHKTIAVTLKKENNHAPDIAKYLKENGVSLSNLTGDAWFIGTAAEMALKEKIEGIGKPLKEWDVKINYGIKTGLNEAFIVDTDTKERLCREDPKSEEVLKPILRGRDIKRYSYDWKGLWLIASGYDIDVPRLYPAIYNHLLQFEEKGKKRYDKGENWWNLRACDYYSEFEKEKVVWKALSLEPSFCYIHDEMFHNDKANLMTSNSKDLKYLCGFLNSTTFQFLFSQIGINMGKGWEYKIQFLNKIPLPQITQANRPTVDKIEQLVEQILSITKDDDYLNTPDKQAEVKILEKEIDQLVYNLYNLTPDEIKVVEAH